MSAKRMCMLVPTMTVKQRHWDSRGQINQLRGDRFAMCKALESRGSGCRRGCGCAHARVHVCDKARSMAHVLALAPPVSCVVEPYAADACLPTVLLIIRGERLTKHTNLTHGVGVGGGVGVWCVCVCVV